MKQHDEVNSAKSIAARRGGVERREDELSNSKFDAGYNLDNAFIAIAPPNRSFLHLFDDIVEKHDIPQYILEHKNSLRFPEVLLLMLVQAERLAFTSSCRPARPCIEWNLNGTRIIIRNKEELTNRLLPLVFSKSMFSSFTRKLYRWGFRQVQDDKTKSTSKNTKQRNNSDGRFKTFPQQEELGFFHPLFLRDNKLLAAGMKSITAETRRKEASAQTSNKIGNTSSSSSSSPETQQVSSSIPAICVDGLFTTRPDLHVAPALVRPRTEDTTSFLMNGNNSILSLLAQRFPLSVLERALVDQATLQVLHDAATMRLTLQARSRSDDLLLQQVLTHLQRHGVVHNMFYAMNESRSPTFLGHFPRTDGAGPF